MMQLTLDLTGYVIVSIVWGGLMLIPIWRKNRKLDRLISDAEIQKRYAEAELMRASAIVRGNERYVDSADALHDAIKRVEFLSVRPKLVDASDVPQEALDTVKSFYINRIRELTRVMQETSGDVYYRA